VEFWRLTPRLVETIASAARRRLDHEHNGRAWLAHTIEGLHRQKRMPRLETLMVRKRNPRGQTWDQQRAICRSIAAYYGSKPDNG
jgi:hypothetical protein